jgi:hypothetical protein
MYEQEDVFFWLMPLSIHGIAWSEKRDENKQASINRWEIGFIPFFRTNVIHNRGIAKRDISLSSYLPTSYHVVFANVIEFDFLFPASGLN